MDMPVYHLTQIPVTEEMTAAIGFRPPEAWKGHDLVCVIENETQVINATPKEEKKGTGRLALATDSSRGKI